MKNELLTKGIILPSGEIGKDKINLVAGAITQPFAEMVWVTTGGDMETINRLTNVLVTEYFHAWEPSVSRLRAIKKFLPSEPLLPQDIVKGLCQ